ncbi:MAG: hypothetical protein J0H68_05155 [Sphingobacteriia bacterium]|nr:hypothetical protein [Sphingobacteriia bacterium]
MLHKYENKFDRLPLLEKLVEEINENIFESVYILACQHVLPSVHLMIRSMVDLGLSKDNVAVIGKCYSTSQLAMTNMNKEGIYVCKTSSMFDSHKTFDHQFIENIDKFIDFQMHRMSLSKDKKIIIIDDGGELITAFKQKFPNFTNVFAIEQTTAGYNKLKPLELNFPVVNIARSHTKLELEPQMIAKSILKVLLNNISSLNLNISNALIIGNGAIGNALGQQLKNLYNITMYDKKAYKSEINKTQLKLNEFDLIIGSTGTNVLNQNDYKLLKHNTILASASSSDREFNALYLRKFKDQTTNCHEIVNSNNIYLLNSGFPLNFIGSDYDSVPVEKIQLIIGLMFYATVQFLLNPKEYKNGLVKPSFSTQKKILNLFFNSFNASKFCKAA